MIHIIEGPSGSGKSYQLYTRLIEQSMKEPERQFFLIVPEQATMQAQRDIVSMHPKHGTMNIDIVSFNRLAYRVFEEQNIKCDHVLEDFGKSMLLKRILLTYSDELPIFGPNVVRDGFIDELKSLFTELFQYRITEERLSEILNAAGGQSLDQYGVLKQKLKDLLFVYHQFQQEIQGTYIIAEHILEMLALHVPDSGLLEESVLFLDGYTGFTPIQYDLLEALAQKVSSMTITVTIDEAAASQEMLAEHELFYLSKDTINRIRKLGERLDIYVEEEYLTAASPRFQSVPELAFLENNLFRYPYSVWNGGGTAQAEEEGEQSVGDGLGAVLRNIHVLELKDARQELREVARRIRSMVRTGKYRYRDIAIIHGGLEEISPLVEELFPSLEIPYFIDMNQNMYMNPCLESIRALLDIAEQDYSYDSVFRFLKTGIMGYAEAAEHRLDYDEVEALENYCRKYGIRGMAWWGQAFSEDSLQTCTEGSDKYRAVRSGQKVFANLSVFTKKLQKAEKVKEYTELIIQFLTEIGMEQILAQKVEDFDRKADYVQAKAYSQIYDKLMDILNKMQGILGEADMKINEFHALLDTGLDDIALGVIPPSVDQLVIGDIERTRLDHIKVLFVMGINDGIIPKTSRGAGILSEADRSVLSGVLELAPDSRQQVFTEQFYIYQNITKPSEHLYLTYHTQDSDGNEVLPAYLISRIRKIFPKLKEDNCPDMDKMSWDRIETEKDSRELLVLRMHDKKKQRLSEDEGSIWKGLYLYYQQAAPEVLENLQKGIGYHNLDHMLTKETALRLYGDYLKTSVSRLETYSRCPYQFFLEYGLGLKVREKNEVSLNDMGTMLHGVVEQVFRQVENRRAEDCMVQEESTDNPWSTISDEELTKLTMQAVDRIADSEEGKIYSQTSTNRNLLQRIRHTAAYAVLNLKEQLLTGKMIPYRFELTFNRDYVESAYKDLDSAELHLQQDKVMKLSGVIDRIDVCQDDSHVYVKILDYKSSQKELEMTQVTAGLQLQLLIYTNVVMEVLARQFPEKQIIPAGSLYYGFKVPMVEKAGEDTMLRNIAKATAMTGIVNQDTPCIAYMGGEEILPVHAVKEATAEDVPITTESYLELLQDVRETAKELGEEMLDGEIPIRPVRVGRGLTCDYCNYRDVCKIDMKDGGNRSVTVEQLKHLRDERKS